MSAIDTSFEVFKQLLAESVDSNANLSSTLKASLKVMVDGMPRQSLVLLEASNVDTAAGNVSFDPANDLMEVASGTPATPNRIEWNAVTFSVPHTLETAIGVGPIPASLGNVGGSTLSPVASSDLSMQYRLSTTDPWVAVTRTTILRDVTWIQFAVEIADQTANVAVPKLHLVFSAQ